MHLLQSKNPQIVCPGFEPQTSCRATCSSTATCARLGLTREPNELARLMSESRVQMVFIGAFYLFSINRFH